MSSQSLNGTIAILRPSIFYFLIISPKTEPMIGVIKGFNNNPNKAPPFLLIIFFFFSTSGTCLELSKRICCFLAHN